MISKVKHMKECMKVSAWKKESARDNRIFPVVSMCWHTPLIHVVTLTKSLVTSHVTETWALTKSLRSPSRRGGAQATYNLLLRAPTILGKLREKHFDHQDRLGAAKHQE